MSDSDIDVNELDYDIFCGPPPILPHRNMRIRLIWPLKFYIDPITSLLIANMPSDDVQQSIAAYYRLLNYVRESSGAAKENEVHQFLLDYACCPDNFIPRMRQMLFPFSSFIRAGTDDRKMSAMCRFLSERK